MKVNPIYSRIALRSRRGFSLVEVLLAIFILGIGMIMVASVFPVGAEWTRQTTEDSVAQTISQDALGVIQMYYGPGGSLHGQLTPLNLQDALALPAADPETGFAFGLQAMPGFMSIPLPYRSYQFGSATPFPAPNPLACNYFWTALVRLNPGMQKDALNKFVPSASYKYDVYILVFRKGDPNQDFSNQTGGPEIAGMRNFTPPVPNIPELIVPSVWRQNYDPGVYNANTSPTITNAVPPMGGIGIGCVSGTVFRQGLDAAVLPPRAIARPGLITLPSPEKIIMCPAADLPGQTNASPLIYVFQTTLSM